jgi:hypothetical protein
VHVALLIQHAARMRHDVTSFVAPSPPAYVLILFHKRHDFRKKKVEHKLYFDFFYNFCLKHF